VRIGLVFEHPAAMAPAVAEVKGEAKLVAWPHLPGDLQHRLVLPHKLGLELLAWKPDPPPIGKLELMQMRQIPARERLIDRPRQLLEGMTRPHDQHPPRRRIQIRPRRPQQINPDLKPRPRHSAQATARF